MTEPDPGTVDVSTELAMPDGGPLQLLLNLEVAEMVDEVSLTIDRPIPYESWEALGKFLGNLDKRTRWYLGDWLIYGESQFGEEAAQAIDDPKTRYDIARRVTGLDPATLQNIRWICDAIPRERRRVELGFWVHAEVAPMEPEEQVEWLQRAIDEGWSRKDLKKAIREAQADPPEPSPARDGGEHLSIGERIENAARLVYHQAQRTDGGAVIVPPEPWAQLTEALGEE